MTTIRPTNSIPVYQSYWLGNTGSDLVHARYDDDGIELQPQLRGLNPYVGDKSNSVIPNAQATGATVHRLTSLLSSRSRA